MAGRNIKITDQGAVIFTENEDGAKTVSLKAPSDVTTQYTTALPAAPAAGTTLMNATRSGVSEPYDVTLSFSPAANVGMAGVNVLNHSVTGTALVTNTGDDTTNIVAAVNAAETSGANGLSERLVFPAGGYRLKELGKAGVHDCFAYDKNYWFEGAGMGMTNMFCAMDGADTPGTHSMIELAGSAPRFFGITDMTFDGNGGGTDSEDLAAINISADYIVIDNVEFKNFTDPILRITGAPKFVSITNCRFTDLVENEGESRQAMVCLDGVSSPECTFIFDGNYMVAYPDEASTDGDSLNGVNVAPNAVGRKIRCFIKNNYFSKLGNPSVTPWAAVTLEPGCHDSVISNNIFDNCVHSSIHVESCNNIEISNNTLASEDSEMAVGADVIGIYVDSDAASSSNLRITGNSITGTVKTDIGIKVLGDVGTDNSIDGVIIADNVIDGCKNALSIDKVKGKVDIVRNNIKNDSSAVDAFVATRHAVYINDIMGAATVNIIGNSFTGGSSSGGAIHFDRSIDPQTTSEAHVVLKDNFFDRMGQHANWSNGSTINDDMALVYINGKDATDRIKTFHASGNRYDFTSALAGTYGLWVKDISETSTFDSILEFGAVGDGTTDCTVAIARASVAADNGGTIHIPGGTFLVSDYGVANAASADDSATPTDTCIQPIYDNQIWTGAGTITVAAGSSDVLLELGAAITGTIVRGLTFLGDATNTGRAIRMVALSSGNHGTVDACKISLFGTGVSAYGPGSKVINCNIENCKTYGIEGGVDSNGDELTISGNAITFAHPPSGVNVGLYIKGKNSHITSNTISNAAANAIRVGANSETISIQGNTINSGSGAVVGATFNPVHVYKSKDISISGNTITGTGAHVLTREDILLDSDSGSADTDVCNKCVITGNTITSNNVKIAVDGNAYAITITNNTLVTTQDPSSIADSKGNLLHGIDFENAGGAIVSNVSDSIITGNIIIGEAAFSGGTPPGNAAINLGAGDRNTVMGNMYKTWNIGIKVLEDGEYNYLIGNNPSAVTTNLEDGNPVTTTTTVDLVTSGTGLATANTSVTTGRLIVQNHFQWGLSNFTQTANSHGGLYDKATGLVTTVFTDGDGKPGAPYPFGGNVVDGNSPTVEIYNQGRINIAVDPDTGMAHTFTRIKTNGTHGDTCYCIHIDSNHTRVTAQGGNDAQALATAKWDGLVIFLVNEGTGNIRFKLANQTGVGAWGNGASLIQAGSGWNTIGLSYDGDELIDFQPFQTIIFRFEHNGIEGAWRLLGQPRGVEDYG